MAKSSAPSTRPSKIWWLIGIIVLMGCVLVQMPALWLVNQFVPDSPYLQQVSGNIWRGSAVIKVATPAPSASSQPLTGTVSWKWRPLVMLLGKFGADVEVISGQTRLEGQISRGLSSWQVSDFSGKIDKQTLASVVNWQLPDAPIQVNGLTLTKHKEDGFRNVDGQLTWVGGELGYPSGGKVLNLVLPPMQADITQETRNNSEVIHANLVDNQSKRLGDFYIDNEGMIDVSLTQRLLENMPSYKGSAPADTAVVSVRQPLLGSLNSRSTGAAISSAPNTDTVSGGAR